MAVACGVRTSLTSVLNSMAAAAMMPRSFETFLRPASLPGVSFMRILLNTNEDECLEVLSIVNQRAGESGVSGLIGGWHSGSRTMCNHGSQYALTTRGGGAAGGRPNEAPEAIMRPLPRLVGSVPNFGDGAQAQLLPKGRPCLTTPQARVGQC